MFRLPLSGKIVYETRKLPTKTVRIYLRTIVTSLLCRDYKSSRSAFLTHSFVTEVIFIYITRKFRQ